jgi:hypothetical protein
MFCRLTSVRDCPCLRCVVANSASLGGNKTLTQEHCRSYHYLISNCSVVQISQARTKDPLLPAGVCRFRKRPPALPRKK